MESAPDTRTVSISSDEAQSLIAEARSGRLEQTCFFNSERGAKLRNSVAGPISRTTRSLDCVLCGQHTNGKRWHGFRTSISCDCCSVSLCLKVPKEFSRSCWSTRHCSKQLQHHHSQIPPSNEVGSSSLSVDSAQQDGITPRSKHIHVLKEIRNYAFYEIIIFHKKIWSLLRSKYWS